MYKHRLFWEMHPAVLLGISFLIGVGLALFSWPLWLSLCWICYLAAMKKWAAFSLLPTAAIYSYLLLGSFPQLVEPRSVTGIFKIASVQLNKTPFHQNFLYRGALSLEHAQIPCMISVQTGHRPTASCDYRVTGTLIQRGPYDYFLKAKKWEEIPQTWSLAEARFLAKSKLRQFLHSKLHRPRTASLMTSLATGEVEDRLLRYEFSRLGLQHILAISGFHFGVLIAFLSLLLKFFPRQIQWIAMMALTTAYYLFIGDSPAVKRAWIIVSLFLLAKLLKRPSSSINLLGGALLIELIYNPLVAANVGFQLSFGSCFGILLLYRPIEQALQRLLPKRTVRQSTELPIFSGLISILSTAMRNAISLTLAVNLTLLPFLFIHFGKFPLLSLLYNLFFPYLISLGLFGLLITILASLLIAPLGHPLFTALDCFTAQLLDLVSYPPLLLDYSVYIQSFPAQVIPIYLFILLNFSVYFSKNLMNEIPELVIE